MRNFRSTAGQNRCLIQALESRRLLSAGSLDTSFAKDGVTSAAFDTVSVRGNSTAVQPDGKIVEVGTTSDGKLALVRYNTDGTLDKSFGSQGTGKETMHVLTADLANVGLAVAIQPDGKIVVAGQALGPYPGLDDFMIVCRFNSNGSFDNTFDHDGITNFQGIQSSAISDNARGNAIAIQNDGKIIIAGDEEQGDLNPNDNLILIRLNTDGSVDQNFGIGGSVDFDHDDNEVARAITIDYNGTSSTNPDYGKIIVVGHVSSNEETVTDYYGDGDTNATYKALIVRFTANGQLDKSFNGTGYIDSKIGGTGASVDAQGVAIEGNGYVVVAGSQGKNLGSTDHDYLVARFTPTGARDTTFGGNGTVIVNMGGNDEATSVVIGGFGQQIIVGGTSGSSFALAAFNDNGLLDTSFGNKGKVITTTEHTASHVQLALGPNHTIVAGGGNNFNAARYFDASPNVSITATDATAGPTTHKLVGKILEPVPNTATMIVARDERLDVATRVYFTIGGTAKLPNTSNNKLGKANYTLSGMTIPISPANNTTGYVDIPAGQTFVTVTLTPENIPANTQTATFSINSNVNYQTSTPPSQTITILGTNPQPVTTVLKDTADAYVRDGSSANTNFGTATQLVVKKSGTSGDNRLAYFKFDLSSISSVNSVTFSIFGGLNNTSNTNLQTQLFSVADTSWTETGITFNNKPAAGTTAIASATIADTTQHTHQFDVTAYVKAQLAAGHKIVSFVLINPTNSGAAFLVNSKEASSNQPTLTIT